MNKHADWEEYVIGLVEGAVDDANCTEELLEYIVELTQEAYIKGRLAGTQLGED